MRNNSFIYLLTGEIQSGKTSALLNWVKTAPSVGGILNPVVGGVRHLMEVRTSELHEFEIRHESNKSLINVGRFNFLESAFQKARQILLSELELKPEWLIVDEIGKLELKDEGLEPAVSKVINFYQTSKQRNKLILVVRKSLLEDVINKYALNGVNIVNKSEF